MPYDTVKYCLHKLDPKDLLQLKYGQQQRENHKQYIYAYSDSI